MPPDRLGDKIHPICRFSPQFLRPISAFCNTFARSVWSGKTHYELFFRKNQVFFCRTHLPFLRNTPLFSLILPHYPKIAVPVGPRIRPLDACYSFFVTILSIFV
jgi:hypothetical protein